MNNNNSKILIYRKKKSIHSLLLNKINRIKIRKNSNSNTGELDMGIELISNQINNIKNKINSIQFQLSI